MDEIRNKLIELQTEAIRKFMATATNTPLVGFITDHLIANGVTVQRWIPVEERLPQKIDEYNVMIEGAESPTTLWYLHGYGRWCEIVDGEIGEAYAVTHWMPLPEPPGKDVGGDA